jgi:hypothetical protein
MIKGFKKNKEDLTRIVFVVDEASMLSNPQGHKIMQLIDFKLVFEYSAFRHWYF